MKKLLTIIILVLAGMAVYSQSGADSVVSAFSDSVIIQDKSFAYMSTLDSLLRQINHETDSLNKAKIANQMDKERRFVFPGSWVNNPVIRTVFWVIIGLFILYVVKKLFDINLLSGHRADDKASTVHEDDELKLPEWYQQQIAKAESAGDLTLATRYQFMHILALFNDGGLIRYLPEKTNKAYADELQDNMLRERFQHIAHIYEYVWYGVRKISTDQYAYIKNFFTQTSELL